jgi:hypothetical protein
MSLENIAAAHPDTPDPRPVPPSELTAEAQWVRQTIISVLAALTPEDKTVVLATLDAAPVVAPRADAALREAAWWDERTDRYVVALEDALAVLRAPMTADTPDPRPQITRAKRGDAVDCECVPGHQCDCDYLRSMLYAILTTDEYNKMEAEGAAADALALEWSEVEDCYVRR